MIRTTLLAAALGTTLLAGCASLGSSESGDSGLVAEIRQELALDPLLNSSQITVTETDGRVVIGGFADSLEDLQEISDVVEGVDGVMEVDNRVIVQSGS